MLALITAALEGLAALPKIFDFLVNQNITARLRALEENKIKVAAAYEMAKRATTTEEKQNAADAILNAWNS